MKRVVIIQEHLPHYRTPFFERLKVLLAGEGIGLEVVFGENESPRFVMEPPSWAKTVKVRRFGPVVHQDAFRHCRDADLVIVPQEVKYLLTHRLFLRMLCGRGRLAFWGHGRNFQSTRPNGAAERLKRMMSRRVDWWFAYNDLSARVVRELGYPAERITSVGNTVDTTRMIEARKSVTDGELEALRGRLGITSDKVAVFTGALYSKKRIPLLLEAAAMIRREVPDFHLIVIGEGPDRALVGEAAAANPWIHDLGKLGDVEKVPYWALSKLLLMPGLVGLVIVDSFALGVPMVTTDYPFHSPEIDYIEDGVNGVVVEGWESAEKYAAAVVELLRDGAALERLRTGALVSADQYRIEGMAENMCRGIRLALKGT